MSIVMHYDYDSYIHASNCIDKEFCENFDEVVTCLERWDSIVNSAAHSFQNDGEAFSLSLHSHSLFLSAIRLARSGHSAAVYPLLRTAFESATYALLFTQDEDLVEKWKNRHVSEEHFRQSKTAFTPAMKKLRLIFKEYDKTSRCSSYEEYIMSTYDAVIDFGAHPNPITITNNSEISSDGDLSKYEYLNRLDDQMIKAIFACIDFGVVLSVVMYLSQILRDLGAPGLDEKFMPFINENNAIADKINGKPIGFNNRYYSRVNPYAK
ncbi:MAG: hypothetical protein GX025_10545 [Clostridiales bacterium]|nr:hypothetical protein [Clostridiales bacterium]